MKEDQYEIIDIQHHEIVHNKRIRRSPELHIKTFDQDITLYLEETNGVLIGKETPIFIAKRDRARNKTVFERNVS